MKKQFKISIVLFWVFLVLISLAGGYLIYYNTNLGPWAFSDSSVYVAAGINWINGGGVGFTQPNGDFARLTHYPPGYPVLIGLTSLVTASPVEAARWIDIVCFALLIFLGGWLIWRITSSRLFPLLYGLIILYSPFLLNSFSGVMSEASAILTGTLALLLLVLFTKTERLLHLVLAGLLSAAAVFIRYQQVSVLVSGCIFLLLFLKSPWIARLKSLVVYAVVSAAPFAAWLLVESLVYGRGARTVTLMGDPGTIASKLFLNIYNSAKYWFPYRSGLLPGVDATVVRMLLVIGFLALIMYGFLQSRQNRNSLADYSASRKLVLISAIYLVIYLLFLLAASLFTSPPPAISKRMLSPMLPFLFILILGLEYIATRIFRNRWWGIAVMCFTFVLFSLTFGPQVKRVSILMHGYGEGYTSSRLKDTPFISQIQKLSDEKRIITNSVSITLFYTQKEAYRSFEGLADPAIQTTKRYGDVDTPAQLAFREECAALVIFDPSNFERMDRESARNFPVEVYGVTEGLVEVFTDPLGRIYLYPGCE